MAYIANDCEPLQTGLEVCKTPIRGFESHPRLQVIYNNGLVRADRLKSSAVLAPRRTKGGQSNPIISIRAVLLLFGTDLSITNLFPLKLIKSWNLQE